jgi:hypothetical protein
VQVEPDAPKAVQGDGDAENEEQRMRRSFWQRARYGEAFLTQQDGEGMVLLAEEVGHPRVEERKG